jgi:hypothetical protein
MENKIETTASYLEDNKFNGDLATILNFYGIDKELESPDSVLADYLVDCLKALKNLKTKESIF